MITATSETVASLVGPEMRLSRLLEAPRALVWKAWSEPHHLGQWWGPQGFTTTTESLDLCTGGHWIHTMHGPDGTDYPNRIRFLEVVPGERLVYRHDSGQDDDPLGFTTTVTFTERGDYTELVMSGVFASVAARDEVIARYGALEGGKQTLARLADEVAVLPEAGVFTLSRTFDAPRDLMWKAWTEPERLARWWGPKGMATLRATVDLRPGGRFHYGLTMPDGREVWGKFIYRDLAPPSRLVFVDSFSDAEGGTTRHPMSPEWPLEMLNVLTLEAQEGRTILHLRITPLHATVAECAVFAEGLASMQQGFRGTLDQLEAYLAEA